jgi:exopolysaccharide biosynthesis polyprenyl glycosylphosphotransferase
MTTTEVASAYPQSRGGLRDAARPRKGSWPAPLLPVDVATLALAVVLAEVGAARAGVPPTQLTVLLGFPALTLALLAIRGTYRRRVRTSVFDDVRVVLTTSALAAMVTLFVRAFFTTDPAVAQQGARLWAFAAVFVAGGRVTYYWNERSARRAGESLKPTLIIGAGRVGRLTAQRLLAMPQLGLKPIGFLDKDPLAPAPVAANGVVLPVLGASWDLENVVRRHEVEQVIITFSKAPNDVLLRLFRRCEELGLAVSMVPRLYELTTHRVSVEHLGGLPLVSAHPADPRGLQFVLKYAVDRILSTALIVVLSPLLIAAGVATYLSLGRPIFFRQRRVGRDGVEFDMLKFRTMRGKPEERGEADADWAKQQLEGSPAPAVAAAPSEQLATPVGKLLRRFSIDELPQLFNVQLGHMSIVGPRPERVHYVRQFEQNIYRYGDRHRVKSGITGWAQANGLRGNTSLADRVEWDNYYIENFSLWLDLKIVLMTFAAIFTRFKTAD